ncbi:hypothetical protein [Ciceribacter sp. L1K22]|uniref:TPR end-of-group domain-containing protein n=1 Tax=Ciceribacter sp. L1K22 TaxID=2820275 RepID=UPI001ABEC445|nr:hypothetical protein [Ciceribacter sp. L1K22]MBO3759539.1 hypothetical protein [Ciceribacter sp. L1K22]
MTKYKADIQELVSTIRRSPKKFDFLTGAGLSKSAGIPLASELVRQIASDYPERIDRLPKGQRTDYGACMNELSIDERHDFLDEYLKKSRINWAHIALACMMKEKHVRRVLTFNFDNVLARACGLLGLYPATYDFGIAPAEEVDFLSDPCIVHLHGQGVGPVMMNSTRETANHADKLKPLITNVYNNANLLVIGYSGEADQVFPILKECYHGRRHIYWVGYSEAPRQHIRDLLNSDHGRYCHYLGGADADAFMIELAQELGCFPPKVFADPAGHLKTELTEIAPFPLEMTRQSIDLLKDTTERLDLHRDALRFSPTQKAVVEGRPEDLIDQPPTPNETSDRINDIDVETQAWAHFSRACRIAEDAELGNDIELYLSAAVEYGKAAKLRPNFPEVFNNWGNVLVDLARLKQEPALLEQAFEKYQKSLELNSDDAALFNNWGVALSTLAKFKQEPALLEQALEKYEKSLELNPDNATLFNNWGVALSTLAKFKQEPALLEQALEKYQKSFELRPDNADLFNNWGIALSDLAKLKQERALFEQAFEKYERSLELNPNEADLFNNWGNALSGLARLKQEPALFEQAFEKYERSLELNPNEADLFNNWGNALSGLARLKHEPVLFEQAFEKYERSLELNPNDADFLNNWGIALSELARLKQEPALFKEALKKVEHGVALNPAATYNRACILALLGDAEGCQKDLEKALRSGTLPLAQHLLEDDDLRSVRDEAWFQSLLMQASK